MAVFYLYFKKLVKKISTDSNYLYVNMVLVFAIFYSYFNIAIL